MTVTKKGSQAKTLAVSEICAIIDSCAKNGVTTLQFGDLEIQRGPSAPRSESPEAPASLAPAAQVQEIIPVAEMTDKQHTENNDRSLANEELKLREEQIAEMLVTDPVAAEKLILEGELEDADNESGADE